MTIWQQPKNYRKPKFCRHRPLTKKGADTVKIVHFTTEDILELKKTHPCGTRTFSVLRIGSEVRIRCMGCGRDMTVDRIKLEKAIRRVIAPSERDSSPQ